MLHVDPVGNEAAIALSPNMSCPTRAMRSPRRRRGRRPQPGWLLAASSHGKLAPEDRLARLGDALDFDDHVGVRAADDEDEGLVIKEME